MVRVLPSGVVADCGKPTALPPLTTVMPPMVKVCRPSGAVTEKLPPWVNAGPFGLLPSERCFSKTVSSPPSTFRPLRVIGSLRLLTLSFNVAVLLSPSESLRV
ncbi:hypothetical protein D3C79_644490 [compost metagenome]